MSFTVHETVTLPVSSMSSQQLQQAIEEGNVIHFPSTAAKEHFEKLKAQLKGRSGAGSGGGADEVSETYHLLDLKGEGQALEAAKESDAR